MRRLVVALIVAALVLPGCTAAPTCREQSKAYLAAAAPLTQEWSDALTLANSTPRSALAAEIAKLQDIRRRLQAVEAPACAAAVKQHQVGAMDESIAGFIAFLGQQDNAVVQDHINRTTLEVQAASTAIAELDAPKK